MVCRQCSLNSYVGLTRSSSKKGAFIVVTNNENHCVVQFFYTVIRFTLILPSVVFFNIIKTTKETRKTKHHKVIMSVGLQVAPPVWIRHDWKESTATRDCPQTMDGGRPWGMGFTPMRHQERMTSLQDDCPQSTRACSLAVGHGDWDLPPCDSPRPISPTSNISSPSD